MNKKARILVIDDDPVCAKLAATIGRFAGYEVQVSTEPAEAAFIAHEWMPDLVVADVLMPGLDGIELCVMLKGHEATKHIPVLLISGAEGEDVEAASAFCGSAEFLAKPFSPVKLIRTINQILGRVAV